MIKRCLIRLLCCIVIFNTEICSAFEPFWYTGPLLDNGAVQVGKGHASFQPYFFQQRSGGITESGTVIQTTLGITDYFEIEPIPAYALNSNGRETSDGMTDWDIFFGFQLYTQKKGEQWPNVMFNINETVPIGEYQRLLPKKDGVDAFGSGSYQTAFVLNFQQESEPWTDHLLNTYLSFGYTYSTRARIAGFNVYGGGNGTKGFFYKGRNLHLDLAFELQVTHEWVGVLELYYNNSKAGRFTGQPGRIPPNQNAVVSQARINQLSLAPAIEYNVSSNVGFLGGVWFDVAGQRINHFKYWVISIVYNV